MKKFLDEDFLLTNKTASILYHEYAKKMPIIDYHCHLSPKDIAEDRVFKTISEAWLAGDHYKWRAMRANGVNEEYITGTKSDKEKFLKWATTVPYTARNPLYHWTHLELKAYFDIDQVLNADSAEEIYEATTSKLNSPGYSCRGLLKKMNVKVVCTTDDPVDDLKYHQKLADESFEIKVLPAFRPDKLYAVEDVSGYLNYLERLESVVGFSIDSFGKLMQAAQQRVDFFDAMGGRLADHGLEQLYNVEYSKEGAEKSFKRLMQKQPLEQGAIEEFKMTALSELCRMYHAKGWTQQFHLGALRGNNSRMLEQIGPDTGFDSIGDFSQARALNAFFDQLDHSDQLTKTIVYNLNPADNEAFATLIGNFNDGTIPGKMQHGSGWWFLDQKDGMEKQMNSLSNMGLLSRFVGMLTDSRSFLSYPRHEYFRRILCNLLGTDVENGELPNDIKWLGGMVEDICYNNAQNYFKF